ncbi:MAG: hypothetical protein AB2809_20975 [Candidatus Thiodiazotropha sp.]
MTFEANPCNNRSLWQRKTLPDHHQNIVSLLVDFSRSMDRGKGEATLGGAAAMVELHSRLGINLSVDEFLMN